MTHAFKTGLNNSNHRKVKVNQYDLDGNLIKKWESLTEAGKNFGTGRTQSQHISLCCKNKRKKAYGYIWKYEN